MIVSGAGFAKPAVEKPLSWKYVCCTPSRVISGLPSLSRGSQRLGFTADANVSHSYFFSEALQLVTIQWYAACSRIMCSQAKTAISKRMAGLLIGAGCSPFTSGYCCPSVVVGHHLTSSQEQCVWPRVPGCALSSFPGIQPLIGRSCHNLARNVPSVKMLLERLGLHQCQGKYGQPVQPTGRIPFVGASVMFRPIAKNPCTC